MKGFYLKINGQQFYHHQQNKGSRSLPIEIHGNTNDLLTNVPSQSDKYGESIVIRGADKTKILSYIR